MEPRTLDLSFEGYFLVRLATDPDPSYEQRGLSGYTYAVAGESLLDPSAFFQLEDVLEAYGWKDAPYRVARFGGDAGYQAMFDVKNVREASPDYAHYVKRGIGVRVTEARVDGVRCEALTRRLADARVRVTNQGVPGETRLGPIFEGRNQIDSDGDPDRFTLNPFVIQVLTYEPNGDDTFARNVLLSRYDPLDHDHADNPQPPLVELTDFEAYYDRLPKQRFGQSQILLDQIGVPDPRAHFASRADWLAGRIALAEALEPPNPGLVEAYRSRAYAVRFFSNSATPSILGDRIANRIGLRQLYDHPVRGLGYKSPPTIVDETAFAGLEIDTETPWNALYYLGAFDGDLLSGYMDGVLSIPLRGGLPAEELGKATE